MFSNESFKAKKRFEAVSEPLLIWNTRKTIIYYVYHIFYITNLNFDTRIAALALLTFKFFSLFLFSEHIFILTPSLVKINYFLVN